MINQRRIFQQNGDVKPYTVVALQKPLTGNQVPIISFNFGQRIQNSSDPSKTFTPRTPLISSNTPANRPLPQYLRANHSSLASCLNRNQAQNKDIHLKENVQIPLPQSNFFEQKPTVDVGVSSALKNELNQLRRANQELKETNSGYLKRLAQLESILSKKEIVTQKKNTKMIPSVKGCSEFQMENRQTKDQPVSIALISNKFMLRQMPDMEDVQYISELQVFKTKTLKQTEGLRQVLCQKQGEIKKLEILLDKSKVSQMLLQRKVEALDVLVAVLNIKNNNQNNAKNQPGEQTSTLENDATHRMITLEEYKSKFDELSSRLDLVFQNNSRQQAKMEQYQKKIAQLQNELAQAKAQNRKNSIIPEQDEIDFSDLL